MAALAILEKHGGHHAGIFRAIKEALAYGVRRETLEVIVQAALNNEEYPTDVSVDAAILATAKKLSTGIEVQSSEDGAPAEAAEGSESWYAAYVQYLINQTIQKWRQEEKLNMTQ